MKRIETLAHISIMRNLSKTKTDVGTSVVRWDPPQVRMSALGGCRVGCDGGVDVGGGGSGRQRTDQRFERRLHGRETLELVGSADLVFDDHADQSMHVTVEPLKQEGDPTGDVLAAVLRHAEGQGHELEEVPLDVSGLVQPDLRLARGLTPVAVAVGGGNPVEHLGGTQVELQLAIRVASVPRREPAGRVVDRERSNPNRPLLGVLLCVGDRLPAEISEGRDAGRAVVLAVRHLTHADGRLVTVNHQTAGHQHSSVPRPGQEPIFPQATLQLALGAALSLHDQSSHQLRSILPRHQNWRPHTRTTPILKPIGPRTDHHRVQGKTIYAAFLQTQQSPTKTKKGGYIILPCLFSFVNTSFQ